MYVIRLPDGNLRVPVGVVGPGRDEEITYRDLASKMAGKTMKSQVYRLTMLHNKKKLLFPRCPK